jgi:hypothetical protein
MLDAVMAKSLLIFHIVGVAVPLFHTLVGGSRVAMFPGSDFDIAQSPFIGLHHPISFCKVGLQSCYVSL